MSTLEPVGVLPSGSFHKATVDGPFVLPCLDREPDGARGQCFRPVNHEGRHAFIATSGRVWSVWGEDVHKPKRVRGHERLVESFRESIEAERQQLRDIATHPTRLGGASW